MIASDVCANLISDSLIWPIAALIMLMVAPSTRILLIVPLIASNDPWTSAFIIIFRFFNSPEAIFPSQWLDSFLLILHPLIVFV